MIVLVNLSIAFCQNQAEANSTVVKQWIESKNFVFQVQSVSPRRGGTIQQTPGYSVVVSKDSVNCYLPYFGRMYQASYGSTDNGLKFISLQFEEKTEPKKKGGWTITLKIKDATSVSQMIFTAFENGRASMTLMCKDRETISYNGYVEGRGIKK